MKTSSAEGLVLFHWKTIANTATSFAFAPSGPPFALRVGRSRSRYNHINVTLARLPPAKHKRLPELEITDRDLATVRFTGAGHCMEDEL